MVVENFKSKNLMSILGEYRLNNINDLLLAIYILYI